MPWCSLGENIVRKCGLKHKFVPTWVAALVGLVPCVSPDVLLQVRQLGELPLTDLTPVRLDAQVNPHVLGKVAAVGEGLTTLAAFVGLGFPHVYLSVQLQVGF